MEITGTIKQINPVQVGQSAKGEWKKQEVIIETEGQYPKTVCITLFNDKTNGTFQVGDVVKFDVNVDSREFNGKYYTTVTAFKYDVQSQAPSFNQPNFDAPATEVDLSGTTKTDDLPF